MREDERFVTCLQGRSQARQSEVPLQFFTDVLLASGKWGKTILEVETIRHCKLATQTVSFALD